MARLSGKAGSVKADATIVALVYGVTSWELDYKGEAVDVTGMDSSGAKAFIGSLTEGTISFECFEDTDHPLNTDILPGLTILWEFRYASGDTSAWHGSAIVTDLKPTVSVDGAVKWSVNAQCTGTFHYAIP